MSVMKIRKMRVAVQQWLVPVLVGMRFLAAPVCLVRMPVMRVVDVAMAVGERLVQMLMIVPLG